jgi:hypothetical protein
MYALAASAAGVGALALAQPCEAKIIYTKAHHIIGANQTYRLDLNHDGIADFVLKDFYATFSGMPGGYLKVLPKRSANEVWAEPHCPSEGRDELQTEITRYPRPLDAIKGKTHFGWAPLAVSVQDFTFTRNTDRLRLRDHPRQDDHRRRDQGTR